ncbi:ketopantoate reductase family protein [Aspergillus glaucus CBS 516.65]|uniref:2-dehydropantoate 2-reductase n=1 Tax=Aspergillus glaucus CBS 516.65 TaxID=1160497 RepID=A0A1L9VNL9_ASPGL|nr:hypothetical protein ASPGLDRAFT_34287 [Aspergillus glaucus CBS 516.65]OJJ85499.1 hypothetical protein ASPGLDRAFT_34287 [Aspergillus glaucus CBS 516.65]
MSQKLKVLLIGSGGIGTVTAYALETGGLAEVTAILRSNYAVVEKNGFTIDSVDHGYIQSWRPSHTRNTIPNKEEKTFDYIILTTKNTPDIPPSLPSLIVPAVTPSHTSIILIQNGINIEHPFRERFPTNPIISGVSFTSATEVEPGFIRHDDRDRVRLGPFPYSRNRNSGNGELSERATTATQTFITAYNSPNNHNIVDVQHDPDVPATRWRKLIYNASFNPISAILRMDITRMRVYEHVIDELVKPAMREAIAVAGALGVRVVNGDEDEEGVIEQAVRCDPPEAFFRPSMCQDVEKGNYMEIENIVGEPLREGERLGVSTPTLRTIYAILKGLQVKVKEERGLVKPEFDEKSRYAGKSESMA